MEFKLNLLIFFIVFPTMAVFFNGNSVDLSRKERNVIPLFFGTDMEEQKYAILPPEVVMFPQTYFDEGFTRYAIRVKVDEGLEYDTRNDNFIHPVWLSSASDVDIDSLVHYHPLSKSDLLLIIKSSGISHLQLTEVLDEWDDEFEDK